MAATETSVALNAINKTLKEMSESQGAGIPTPKVADAGKVLMVGEDGKWKLAAIPSQLPAVAAADEGKVLTVNSEGAWAAADLPSDDAQAANEGE